MKTKICNVIGAIMLVAVSSTASSSGFSSVNEYRAAVQDEAEAKVREYAARTHAETQAKRKVKSARIEAAWERGMERQRVKNLQYIEDHKKDFSFGWGPWTHAETTVVGRGFNK